MMIGVANAQAKTTMTMTSPDGTVVKSGTVTTYVNEATAANANKTTFSGRIETITAASSVAAGDALPVKVRVQACDYPQTTGSANRPVSILFTRPVLYLTLPDGITIDPESIVIHNTGASEALAEPILTFIKSIEKSGALYNIYKISFSGDVPFGYFKVNSNKSLSSVDNARKDISFSLNIDSAMNSATINWQNCIIFTDDYGSIYNSNNSSRFGSNMVYDTNDVDNDGVTTERFASIAAAQYLTIN